MLSVLFFFFFKQKTAYEMRISDWSSDVCSSDLGRRRGGNGRGASGRSCERRGGGRNAPPSPARDQSWAISAMVTAISRSEEHTSELQSLMRISYAVFCLKQKPNKKNNNNTTHIDNSAHNIS